jgi:hypothetical protein
MNLELQVVSLELAKKLKELKVKQDSIFYWEKCPDYNKFVISCSIYHDIMTSEWTDCHILQKQENYSAFTACELGEFLPYEINLCSLIITKDWDIWEIQYNDSDYPREKIVARSFDNNLANAMAKMLIYLLEQGLIKNND